MNSAAKEATPTPDTAPLHEFPSIETTTDFIGDTDSNEVDMPEPEWVEYEDNSDEDDVQEMGGAKLISSIEVELARKSKLFDVFLKPREERDWQQCDSSLRGTRLGHSERAYRDRTTKACRGEEHTDTISKT